MRKEKLIVLVMKNNTRSSASGHYYLSFRSLITRIKKELRGLCIFHIVHLTAHFNLKVKSFSFFCASRTILTVNY